VAAPAARDFDPGRISPGETIAAASGIGLFIFLFFSWFGAASAWEFFDIVDLLLAVIALWAVAVAGAKAVGMDLPGGDSSGARLAVPGLVATSITLTFVLEGADRKIGLWLAFFASIGILYGGWRVMHEAPGTPGPLAGVGTRSTPGDAEGDAPPPVATAADPVPGITAPLTPPGIVGEPPASEGTHPPGI
jgi:predicted small integral membrane protein